MFSFGKMIGSYLNREISRKSKELVRNLDEDDNNYKQIMNDFKSMLEDNKSIKEIKCKEELNNKVYEIYSLIKSNYIDA